MSIASNLDLNFGENKVVDDYLAYAVATNISQDGYIRRVGGFEELAHNGGQKVWHPTYEGLIRSPQNHLLLSGRITVTYTFNDLNANHISNYIEYMYSEGASNLEFEQTGNKLKFSYLAEYNNKNWDVFPASYSPEAHQVDLDFDEGSDLLCVIRLDNPDSWTLRYKDCKQGESTTIEKAGETCYVFLGGDATKDGSTLTKHKFYKVTSDSFEITANEDLKILRLHCD
jgi:hypothetical protein